MTATAIRQQMTDMTEARTTEQLLIDLEVLNAVAGENPATETRMVHALISDTITERLGLDDLLEEIFMDLDYEGTYLDAIHEAIKRK